VRLDVFQPNESFNKCLFVYQILASSSRLTFNDKVHSQTRPATVPAMVKVGVPELGANMFIFSSGLRDTSNSRFGRKRDGRQ